MKYKNLIKITELNKNTYKVLLDIVRIDKNISNVLLVFVRMNTKVRKFLLRIDRLNMTESTTDINSSVSIFCWYGHTISSSGCPLVI